jgi:predicted O-methyltransferase YrrM
MVDQLEALKRELERFGQANDRAHRDLSRRMLNITRDTGEFLSVLVRATGARRILEIGTSNGYSTLWLAEAARAVGGHVTTVEISDYKTELAAATFARSGLAPVIDLVHEDAARVLEGQPPASFDFVFLDSERSQYPAWWPRLREILRPGALLVADNASTHPMELAPFVALVQADPAFTTSTVAVGNGEFLAVKAPT